MKKLNDLRTNLEENIDLSQDINLETKISKKTKKNSLDLKKWLKNLNLRKKANIKISKLKNKLLDSVFYWENEIIDINTKKDKSIDKKIKKFQFIVKNAWKRKSILIPDNYKKIAILFIAIIFIWLLDKVLLEISVKSWYENLLSVKENFKDIKKVKTDIKTAKNNFFFANLLYAPISFIPNKKVRDVWALIDWWKNLQKLINEGFFVYEKLNNLVNKNTLEEINFIDFLEEIRNKSENIHNLTYNSLLEYEKIWDLWDKNLNDNLKKLKDRLKTLLNFTDKINKNYDEILALLAKDRERRYLIVFQNNDEIRAAWGFMWSFATIHLDNWKIQKIDKKDVYAYEWIINKFYKNKEKAPEWLDKITKTFGLRDANYFPEIKDSAEKIKFFFDKIAYRVDGIIFINQNLIRDLIDSVDYVDSDSLWERITSKNFSEVISTLVEAEVGKKWTIWSPKQILFDFANEFYVKILWEKKYSKYINVILKNIASRDIVFYSFHPKENSTLWKFWLNWNLNFSKTLDFNYPVYTSIWGNKSDRYMKYAYEKIITKNSELNSEWQKSCDYNVKLDIYNNSTFSDKNLFHIEKILSKYKENELWKKKSDILNIQWLSDNKSFLRILIPKNTEVSLSRWQRLEIYNDYKIIEFYTKTPSGLKSSYSISYKLKNPKCKPYNYKFIKQPGIKKYDITFIESWNSKVYENIESDFIYKRD